MPAILDTNILVYAVDAEAEHHVASKALLHQAKAPDAALCLTAQIVAEFCAVVTDRRRVRSPVTPVEATHAIATMLEHPGLSLLPVPIDVTVRFLELLKRGSFVAQQVFDAYLVATMLGNGIRCIHTFNVRDFERFEGIEVRRPEVSPAS